ncbi:MAG: glycoside hydrolase family 1 protein [Myxococcales bacterium]|nr:glycoside hydrolase family 1 protein [Myxococcales bacterium]
MPATCAEVLKWVARIPSDGLGRSAGQGNPTCLQATLLATLQATLLATLLATQACGAAAPTVPPDTADAATTDAGPDADSAAGSDAGAPLGRAFPTGFLWGTAVAGFQVDMGCPTLPADACEDRQSDWWQWVTDPELKQDQTTFLSGQHPNVGPGMWELWPQDFDRAKNDLHNNALRLSIEWSRVFPTAAAGSAKSVAELKGVANAAAVAAYHAMFQGAKQRGLKLLVTLNHYTLPLWLHDGKDCHFKGVAPDTGCKNRGWADRERMLTAITLYAAWCAAEFGAEVDLWGTLNEPFAVIVPGYLIGTKDRTNPPGVPFEIETALSVAFTMMMAHCRMYDAVHAYDKADADGDGKAARVGIVHNLAAMKPKDPNKPGDLVAAQHADYVYNRVFLDATVHGKLDLNLDGKIEGPGEGPLDDMKGRMDFIGVNYYTQLLVSGLAAPLHEKYKFFDFLPDSALLFNDWPAGMHDVVMLAASYGKPVIITENGSGGDKSKILEGFLKPHLAELHRAIQDGAVVEGFFWWSLVDNYEWNHGMAIQMGLYGIDPTDPKKTRKPSLVGAGYAAIAKANGF